MERYLRVNLLGPGPRLIKKRIYRAVVSQRLRNTGLEASVTLKKGYHPRTNIEGDEKSDLFADSHGIRYRWVVGLCRLFNVRVLIMLGTIKYVLIYRRIYSVQ